MDIRELLRHLRADPSNRSVAQTMDIDRRTVGQYRQWATEHGLLEGPLPSVEDLQALVASTFRVTLPPQNVSTVEPYREQIVAWRRENVEVAAIHARLKERGFQHGYMAVYRFVKALEGAKTPEVVVRVETAPGEEAQVDFGDAGYQIDPETGTPRRAYVFVMTLSYSRHQYAELVFDQTIGTWILLHRHAFEFFQGVPERVVPDNLKAAVVKACFDDPQIQTTYRECAEHYGFRIAPCKVRTPEHKGKVEQGGVHYAKRNFLGGREPAELPRANAALRTWCLETAGERVHGTTREQPLARFREVEQARLRPLPETPYDLALWKQAKVQRDGHVVFENAYYSAPCHLVGQQVYVRGGSREVRLYTLEHQLVTTHTRAPHAGEWMTKVEHLPPHKVDGLLLDRPACEATAEEIGTATVEVVQRYFSDPVLDRRHTVIRLLHLRDTYGDARLEAACARALYFEDPHYLTIKEILRTGQDQTPLPAPEPPPSPATTFVRTATELLGHLFGGAAWN
jgi:transposase